MCTRSYITEEALLELTGKKEEKAVYKEKSD